VEIPPKASSASKPDPKDVINLDDLPEDPIGHGDSGKGASSSAPPPDQPSATFAGPTEEEYEQKVQLIHTSSTLQANPQPAPSLQKRSLAERHAEVSAMLDKVWGKSNVEMQELTEQEDGLKVFFAKHKEVRQVTLAPKHWVRHFFRVTCVSRCFSPNCTLGRNLKFHTSKILSSSPAPKILNIWLTPLCFSNHAEIARGSAHPRAGADNGD
jgi:hypothetical protein